MADLPGVAALRWWLILTVKFFDIDGYFYNRSKLGSRNELVINDAKLRQMLPTPRVHGAKARARLKRE